MLAGVMDRSHGCGRAGLHARVETCGLAVHQKTENESQTSSLSTAKDGFRWRVERRQIASRSELDLTSMDSLSTVPAAQPNPHKDWPDDRAALLELVVDGGKKLPQNFWSLGDAFQGVQIFGGTGSGKSSGSGQALARAFLKANLGGLVLTAKTDEAEQWQEYAKDAGRTSDLIIVDAKAKWRFNFLSYEFKRPGAGAGQTENLVNLFCSVLEASERRHGQAGGSDSYWQRTLKQLLRNAIDLSIIAASDVSLPSLYRIITTAPRSPDEAASAEWRTHKDNVCYVLIEVAEKQFADAVKAHDTAQTKPTVEERIRESDFRLTRDYWMREYPSLAIETRSVIVSTFTSMADCFLRGTLGRLFCTEGNFSPEDTFKGRIIVMNLPVKEHNELGQFAQVLFKFIWQRAVERRIPPGIKRKEAEQRIRPVFLWADESQFFANSYDALFQSTARSSRACTVYLTQNLPSYLSVFGGSNSRAEVESFVGNLQTKIFHANGDPTTNNWAADSIGRARQTHYTGGMSEQLGKSAAAGGVSQSSGGHQSVDFVVQPQEFTMLRTGGDENKMLVDGIIFQGGRRWVLNAEPPEKVQNYIRQVFPQVYERHAR